MINIPKIDSDTLKEVFPVVLGSCRYFDFGKGWRGVVGQMCGLFAKLPAGSVSITEMSQKHASLRVWLEAKGLTNEQETFVRHAQVLAVERSRYACEVCGEPGDIRHSPEPSGAWLYCLCRRHLPPERRDWPLVRRERRYEIAGVHWKYDHLLDRLRVDEQGNA
ncbi:hypothetical protein ACTJK5_09515 [Agrobacterium sp. 22094]|uniref:hypothetical protein n=1 Tax=Agrobacterium sp. 22094 TaxID=3453872 RepID=UPI003F83720D